MIQAIVDVVMRIWWSLVPFAVVEFNELGLRERLGKSKPEWELEPGWYWRWWIIDKIETCSSTEDYIDLAYGDMPTKDGDTITFSANLGYKIISPWKLWTSVHDPDENLSRLALGKLAELVAQDENDELAQGSRAVRKWLKDRLTTETKDWGIVITDVFITNWIKNAQRVRLITDGNSTSLVLPNA